MPLPPPAHHAPSSPPSPPPTRPTPTPQDTREHPNIQGRGGQAGACGSSASDGDGDNDWSDELTQLICDLRRQRNPTAELLDANKLKAIAAARVTCHPASYVLQHCVSRAHGRAAAAKLVAWVVTAETKWREIVEEWGARRRTFNSSDKVTRVAWTGALGRACRNATCPT